LSQRISLTIRGPIANADLAFAVRPEISLLATMLYKEDSCWEQKAKCVMQLFFMTCKEFQSSAIVTYITLPCLKMMRNIIKPPNSAAKANKVNTYNFSCFSTFIFWLKCTLPALSQIQIFFNPVFSSNCEYIKIF